MSSDYFDAFVREGHEQITELNNALLALEEDPDDTATMDEIFRSAHTLKGNFAAMGFEDASELAHAVEDMLDEMREDRLDVTPERMDLIFEGVDQLEAILDEIEAEGENTADTDALVEELREAIEEADAAGGEDPGTTADAGTFDARATEGILTVVEDPGRLVGYDGTLYHVRVRITDRGMKGADGMMALQGLSGFDVVAAHPPEEAVEDGDYDDGFDAFVGGGDPGEIQSDLSGQQSVEDVRIRDATAEVEALDADPSADAPATGDDPAGPDPTGVSGDDVAGTDATDAAQSGATDAPDPAQGDTADATATDAADAGSAGTGAAPADDDGPDPSATEAVLAALEDPEPVAAHDGTLYHVRVRITDRGMKGADGMMALQGLSGFDVVAAHPPEEAVEDGDYDDGFDAFVGGGDPGEIRSDLAGQQSVEDVRIRDATAEVEALDAGTGRPAPAAEAGPESTDDPGATADASEGADAAGAEQSPGEAGADDGTADADGTTEGPGDASSVPERPSPSDGDRDGRAGPLAGLRGAIGGLVAAVLGAFGVGVSSGDPGGDATDSGTERPDSPDTTESPTSPDATESTDSTDQDAGRPDSPDATESPDGTTDRRETDAGDDRSADDDTAGADPGGAGRGTTGGTLGEDDAFTDPADAGTDAGSPDGAVSGSTGGVDDGGTGDATDGAVSGSTGGVDDGGAGDAADASGAATGDAGTSDTSAAGAGSPDSGSRGAVTGDTTEDDEWDWDDDEPSPETPEMPETPAPMDEEPADGDDDGTGGGDGGDGGGGGDGGDGGGGGGGGAGPSDDDITSSIDDIKSVRVDVDQLDDLYSLVEQLVTSRIKLRKALEDAEVDVEKDLDELDKTTGSLQDTVMDMRLVPMKKVVGKFPRVVRDLSREQDKEVDFEMRGTDVELDRTILDRLSDPLIHILRNAVDHGIEPPEQREREGKPREGSIVLEARRERDRAIIEVRDDGRGLDAERIRTKAFEQGIRSSDELDSMDDESIYDLIFHPGFSTTDEVTDVSGRGVGMDVVHNTVARLDGSVDVDSEPGEGTTVTLELPVSIAIVKVLFVEAGDHQFGIPIKKIDKVSQFQGAETVNGTKMIQHGDDLYKVIRLHEALDTVDAAASNGQGMIVRVRRDERPVALYCDAVTDQEEVVVKPLEGVLSGTPGLSGTAVLGEGNVVPVLDVKTI